MRKSFRKRKFNQKKKNTYKIFFLVIVGMTLGFAAINTTLQLIGTLNISRTTWNIHWENPTKIGGVTATSDAHLKTGDNTTVEYEVNLANQGDYYEFTVDAKNDGTIDAMITGIDNKVYENSVEVAKPDYLDFIVTYADGTTIANNHLLAASKKETYKVKVMYKNNLTADQLPTQTKTYKFTFKVTYMQADEESSVNRLWTLPAGKNKNNLETGNEICIKDQCFNFIKYDGNNIVMIAEYNLKVGNIYEFEPSTETVRKTGEYTSGDTGYGLQSSEARGWTSIVGPSKGTLNFSTTNYWYNGSNLKPEYGTSYPADVYDATNYIGAPGTQTHSIAYYVEEYKTKLENNYNATIEEARLLTYSEAVAPSIGCGGNSCPTNTFITNTSYWLGSAGSNYNMWCILSNGNFYGYYGENDTFGVRPVIVISKSKI